MDLCMIQYLLVGTASDLNIPSSVAFECAPYLTSALRHCFYFIVPCPFLQDLFCLLLLASLKASILTD